MFRLVYCVLFLHASWRDPHLAHLRCRSGLFAVRLALQSIAGPTEGTNCADKGYTEESWAMLLAQRVARRMRLMEAIEVHRGWPW